MARGKRTYRTPVVITLAALAPGCVQGLIAGGATDSVGPSSGGTPGTDDSADGLSSGGVSAGGTSGSASTGGTSSGGVATGGVSTGGTSTGGATQYPECDSEYGFTSPCPPQVRCQRTMACTSGTSRPFVFECDETGTYWNFQTGDCVLPAEFCSGVYGEATICEDDGWMYQGQGGNPPAPCPTELPAEGAECFPGGSFGADRTACGYPCGEGQWTVVGCFSSAPEDTYGEWQGDGACSNNGFGGTGP